MRTLGVYGRWGTHCRKQWEDLRRWARKMEEAQLGMASQRGRGACRTLTPPDVPHTGSGLSGAGWALEAITAATREVVRTQASTSATQSTATVVSAATAGLSGSREPAITTDSVPAPAAKVKGKEAPPAVKGKEAPPAVKGKEAPPAVKGNEAPPSVKGKEAPSAVKGKSKEAPPTVKDKGKEAPQAGKGKGQEAWCRD
ncbi:hypothetical protein NDU88_007201 [Pleurodeles waltl]|uniref:Uncharacterized protein n=1 Tax=Pleurodeles waltl TaxID=8319 RepID=A0AAV7PN27_PLEWA|nr:hypothetical protein NDU88_007201 [Pleurodeles waltl]